MAFRCALLLAVFLSCLSLASFAGTPDFSTTQCPDLTVENRKLVAQGEINVEDLQFAACNGGEIRAHWVGLSARPTRSQAAVLFVHWYEPGAIDSNPDEFLEEAKALAKRGVVSLLVSTFWSEPNAPYHQRRWQDDYQNTLNQTRDLLRMLEWIRRQPEVDTSRLAYVGHDYGAGFGALVAGIDSQVNAFVLITTPPSLSDWYLYGSASGKPEGKDLANFKERFLTLSPAKMLAKSRARILLQFADDDPYVSEAQARQVIQAAPGARVMRYKVGHNMKLPQAREDREAWLTQVLGLQ